MATPALGTVGTAVQTLSTTTLTIGFTLAAGETLFVAFNGGAASLVGITSVTWNGSENMTAIGAATGGSAFRTCRVYGLAGGTAGTFNVVVTFASTVNAAVGFAFSYTNVNPSTLWDGAQTANGNTSSNPSVTMTSESGDLCVAAFLGSEAYGGFTPTNGTERSEQTTANGSYVLLDRAGSASCQINGTLGSADAWGMVGFNLNATVDTQTLAVTNTNLFWAPYTTWSNGGGSMQSNNVKASSTVAILCNSAGYLKARVTVASGGFGYFGLTLDTTRLNGLTANTCPTLSVNYDGRPFTVFQLAYSATAVTLTLLTGMAVGTHDVEVRFKGLGGAAYGASADRWGTTTPTRPKYVPEITGILIDSTASLAAVTPLDLRYLGFGASNTEAFNVLLPNNDSANDGAAAMNDAYLGHQVGIAIGLGAEYGIAAYGGQGFARGIGNTTASSTNPSFYNTTSANQSWDKYFASNNRDITSPVAPNVIGIDMGYNDDGTLPSSSVTAVLNAIRSAVGTACWIFVFDQNCNDEAAIIAGVAAVSDTRRTKYLTVTGRVTPGTPSAYSGDAAFGGVHLNQLGQSLIQAELIKQMQAYITGLGATPRSRIVNA